MTPLASALQTYRSAQKLPREGATMAWATKVTETARQLREIALAEGMPRDELRVEAWAAKRLAEPISEVEAELGLRSETLALALSDVITRNAEAV